MKLAWLSDIHLDMVSKETVIQLGNAINECDCERAIITGDIANGRSVIQVLSLLDETVRKPIYFVLGNHDSYYGSFQKIHYNMRKFSRKSKFCVKRAATRMATSYTARTSALRSLFSKTLLISSFFSFSFARTDSF